MNAKTILIRLGLGAVVIGLVALVAWWPKGTGVATAGGDTWTCSMHPQIRLPNPGKCPICGMQLIPVSQLPKARGDLETRAGLVTEPIQRRELFKEIRTVGKLDYSERQVEYITSRIAGRVDRLFVDFTGVEVKKKDHLVQIYSPELLVAQNELLLSLEAVEKNQEKPAAGMKSFAHSRLEAARTKLRLLGILEEQITELEEHKQPHTHLTIFAPLSGTVIEKNVRVGQYLNTGDQVYRIANLDPIWLFLNIYEFDIDWVRFGQQVEVRLEAFPGETFTGSIMFIDPFLDDATRTIRVRVNIKNPDRRLKPQMFATATIHVRLRPDGSPEPTGLEGKFVCPMHPEIIQDERGECPICEMPLEKVRERGPKAEGRGTSDEPAGHADRAEKAEAENEQKKTPAEPPQPKSDEKSEHKDHAGHEGHAKKSAAKAESVTASAKPGEGVLAIPVSAVLDTGRRRITYRLTDDGAYELVEVKLGPRAHATDESGKRREFFVVLDGINEGDQVVSQSGFLLDSQRQIEGMPSLLYPEGQAGTALHSGHGGMDMGGKGGAAPSMKDAPSTKEMPSGHKH